MRASPGIRQALRRASIRSGSTAAGSNAVGVDAARDDGEPLARKVVARHDRRGGEIRRRDHPVAARQRAGPIGAQARHRRHVGKRGDEPDRDLRRRHVGAPGAADALGMHDIDPLGRDEVLERARALAQLERVDGVVHQRHPFAAERLELGDQRAIVGRDQRAGAGLQQGVGHIDGGAGHRVLAQGRHDLQDRGAGQCARGHMRLAVAVAHGPHPSPGAARRRRLFPLRRAKFSIRWRHAAKHGTSGDPP